MWSTTEACLLPWRARTYLENTSELWAKKRCWKSSFQETPWQGWAFHAQLLHLSHSLLISSISLETYDKGLQEALPCSTSIFSPGKFHGQRSLVDSSPWVTKIGHNWAHTNTHTRQSHRKRPAVFSLQTFLGLMTTPRTATKLRMKTTWRMTDFRDGRNMALW